MKDTDIWPTPGPNEPVPSWDEYDQLRSAIHDYLDHEPTDPAWDDIWRAFGAIMGDYQRNAFVEAFNLDEPAEQACIRRLITGEEECTHSPIESNSDPSAPLTALQPTTTRRCGLTVVNRRYTRCMSIRGISNASMPPSRRTTSGSTFSSLPPNGA